MSVLRALPVPLLFAAASVLLPAGARLHLAPDAGSTSIAVVDEPVELVPEEARDGWLLVRYDGRRGWMRPGPPEPLFDRPRASTPHSVSEPPTLLLDGPVFPAGRGRELLADRWRIRSDVTDEALLERVRAAVGQAPGRFETWWELPARAASGDVVLLFSRDEDARRLDRLACGRIRNGVVTASVVPGDPDATVRRVLHQVGHLYAVALLGSSIPPWLEEGLADSFAAIGEKGAGLQEPLFRDRRRGRSPSAEDLPVASLFGAGREMFAAGPRGEALRREASRLSRYFWNGGRLLRFERFRSFLLDGLAGRTLHGELLERRIRLPLSRLQEELRSFREAAPGEFRTMRIGG